MNRNYIFLVGRFFFLILLQILIFRNLTLFDTAFVFLYVGFILLLPFELSAVTVIIAGFFTGLIIDAFYNSLGIHAAASALMAFIRSFWTGMITPRGGYDIGSSPGIKDQGFQWYLIYTLPLIFIHHFALFYIESGGFNHFFFIFSKVISSTVFTFIVLVLGQFLFLVKGRRNE